MDIPGKFVRGVFPLSPPKDGLPRYADQMDIRDEPGSDLWKEAFDGEGSQVVRDLLELHPKANVEFIDTSGKTITP